MINNILLNFVFRILNHLTYLLYYENYSNANPIFVPKTDDRPAHQHPT